MITAKLTDIVGYDILEKVGAGGMSAIVILRNEESGETHLRVERSEPCTLRPP